MMQLKSTAETDVTPEPQSPSPLCELKSPVFCTGEQQISLNTIHEIIPRKLSFILFENDAIMKKSIMEQREVYFFSSDYHEAYVPFFEDFGPVDLGLVVQFCRLIEAKTSHPRLGNRTATYYAESDGPRRTNAAFLVGAYLIIMHGWTPEEAVHKLQQLGPGLMLEYKHALNEPSDFKLAVLDCLRGVKRALEMSWLDVKKFDFDKYQLLGDPRQFDLHQVCPNFVVFRGPDSRNCARFHAPEFYCDLLQSMGVTIVIRLNEVESYDSNVFKCKGIQLVDIKLTVGCCPSPEDVEKFLTVCDRAAGVIAVHCTGGRGRSATMICAWMIHRHGWRAREAIGWIRIVRPGSILGVQQSFLEDCEKRLQ